MPRNARKNYDTSFFHIIVQGINKEYIFKEKADMEKYLYLLKYYISDSNINLLAYCIMNNHVHFLINVKDIQEMSTLMSRLNTSYAIYYNKKMNRVGILFRNRYYSQPIYTNEQLHNCIVYIHRNPIKANIVENYEDYEYSSYNYYIRKKGIVTKEIIQLVFENQNYKKEFKEIHEVIEINDIAELIDKLT